MWTPEKDRQLHKYADTCVITLAIFCIAGILVSGVSACAGLVLFSVGLIAGIGGLGVCAYAFWLLSGR